MTRKRKPNTCSKCGAVGFTAQSCGKSHNVGDRDVKPANVPVKAPPPIARTGSRESRPQSLRAEVPANDDEEGPGVELFVTHSNGAGSPRRRRARSRRQRGFARSFTLPEKASDERVGERLHLPVVDQVGADGLAELDALRPHVRGDCMPCSICQEFTDSGRVATPELLACGHRADLAIRRSRPCVFAGCTKHLYLDVTHSGGLKINFPGVEPTELAESCSLDVTLRGPITLEEVGELTNLTRERIRQVEVKGLHKGKAAVVERGIEAEDSHFPHPKSED